MGEIKHLTVTLPSEMAAAVQSAVEGGDDALSSDVVREALCNWNTKRAVQARAFASLKADIDGGMVRPFDSI